MESKRYYVSNSEALSELESRRVFVWEYQLAFGVALGFAIMAMYKSLFHSLSLLVIVIEAIIVIPYIIAALLLTNKSYMQALQNTVPSSLTFSTDELILKFVTGRELKLKREDIFDIVPGASSKKSVDVKILVREGKDEGKIKEIKISLWRKNYEILEKWFAEQTYSTAEENVK